MIKVITFDFWNTIFDSSNGRERNDVRRKSIIEAIAKIDNKLEFDIDGLLQSAWEYFNHNWINENKTPGSLEMVKFFWNKLNLNADYSTILHIANVFEECVLYYPPCLIEGVRTAIEELSKDYKLAIISDTGFSPGRILKSLLNTESILHYFSAFSFSDETNTSKPNPTAFETVLSQFACQPQLALHIGDIERTDIVGAKLLGMKAIRFTGDEASKIYNVSYVDTQADFCSNNWGEITKWIRNNA